MVTLFHVIWIFLGLGLSAIIIVTNKDTIFKEDKVMDFLLLCMVIFSGPIGIVTYLYCKIKEWWAK